MPYPVTEDMVEFLLHGFLAEDPEIEYLLCGGASHLKPVCHSITDL